MKHLSTIIHVERCTRIVLKNFYYILFLKTYIDYKGVRDTETLKNIIYIFVFQIKNSTVFLKYKAHVL